MQKLPENLPLRAIGPKGTRPKILINSLPESAGIYIYFKGSIVIYVGKAINLKRRISSYFDLDLDTKTAKMISEATHYTTFIGFARKYAAGVDVDKRWKEFLLYEAEIISKYGKKETIHG